jgi:hypothetical protein
MQAGKRPASMMRGEHQGERADQGGEQEKMLMLGVLQRGCELAAQPVDRRQNTEQQIIAAGKSSRKPSIRKHEWRYSFQHVWQQDRKGADGQQSLAMATWRICGAVRQHVEMPEVSTSRANGARGNAFRRFSVEGGSTKEAVMKIFAWIFAAAISLTSLPALAGSPTEQDGSLVLAGGRLCIGPGCRDRDDDWRWRHRHGYGFDRGGCRDVTVREHRDGETIVRHTRRCD